MFCRRCYRCRGGYRGNSKNEINFDNLKDKVSKGAILVDVRSPQEFNEGHLNGAINIPEYEIRKRIMNEIPKLNQQIVLYCQYGGRSQYALNMMTRMGYNNVYVLKGGLEII